MSGRDGNLTATIIWVTILGYVFRDEAALDQVDQTILPSSTDSQRPNGNVVSLFEWMQQ